MCNPPCERHHQDAHRVVIKHTFLEVVDSPCGCDRTSALKRRTQSDSYLCKRGLEDDDEDCSDRESSRLSDSDTSSKTTCNSRGTSLVSCTTTSSSSSGGSPAVRADPLGAPAAPWAARTPFEETYGSASHEAVISALAYENALLAQRNASLRETIGLIQGQQVNRGLAPWTGTAPPSPMPYHLPEAVVVGPEDFRAGGHVHSSAGVPGMAVWSNHEIGHAELMRGLPRSGPADVASTKTTLMLRNLPNNYTRAMLLRLLDKEGFAGLYDFVYFPIDFVSHAALGYAFVNLVHPSVVDQFWTTFDGYNRWVLPSRKTCFVSWSDPHQGLEANVERYRNSPVLHELVPDEYKPVVFKDGVRVAFPRPTKSVRAPRVRGTVGQGHKDSFQGWPA